MEKIKFCHLVDGSTPNPLLYNSIKYSDREKFDYTVISLQPAGGLQKQMEELGLRSFSLDYTSRKQSVLTLWKLYRLFRKEKFQIVQTHLLDSSLIGLTAALLARVPVRVFTGHHSHEIPLHKRKLLTFIDGLNGRVLANHIIAPSLQMKEIFIEAEKVPEEKITVIHHGFDLEAWRKSAELSNLKKELGIENKIVIGAVGRLFWVKGFENLIKAFAEVSGIRDDIVLLIVGDGSDKEKLQNLINSLNLQKNVILTGARKDIAKVMNDFDIFIHPAFAESFGMIFIEVFALGKPIITTNVGVAPEIIENGVNGLLMKNNNKEELFRAIIEMLDRRDKWQEMGAAGKNVADKFAVQKTQALCDNFYLKWLKIG